mmetsp:Transcript_7328/g.14694  ORF Transcript_7328/g.14694 Transcript_7328/m.14694 type:complete len:222 (+) Transcript_7328:1515-2180(+)
MFLRCWGVGNARCFQSLIHPCQSFHQPLFQFGSFVLPKCLTIHRHAFQQDISVCIIVSLYSPLIQLVPGRRDEILYVFVRPCPLSQFFPSCTSRIPKHRIFPHSSIPKTDSICRICLTSLSILADQKSKAIWTDGSATSNASHGLTFTLPAIDGVPTAHAKCFIVIPHWTHFKWSVSIFVQVRGTPVGIWILCHLHCQQIIDKTVHINVRCIVAGCDISGQ